MPTGSDDAQAAEHSLRSVERLIEEGDLGMAAAALELVIPGIETLMDDRQAARLSAAKGVVFVASEEGPEAVQEGPSVVPFGRR